MEGAALATPQSHPLWHWILSGVSVHAKARFHSDGPAASYKSPYRKCAGVMLHRLTPRFRAGALVDRALSTGHPFGGGCMSQELPQSLPRTGYKHEYLRSSSWFIREASLSGARLGAR
jgi:hypothetical protein